MMKRLLRSFALFICAVLALPTPGLAKKGGCLTCKAALSKKKLKKQTAQTKQEQVPTKPPTEQKTIVLKTDSPDKEVSTETRSVPKKMTFNHDLQVSGNTTLDGATAINENLTIGDCKSIAVDKITVKSQDNIAVFNDLALRPCKKILVNEIAPVFKAIDPDACNGFVFEENEDGIIRLNGTTAVNPTKKLLVNEIGAATTASMFCPDANEYITAYIENEAGSTHFSSSVSFAKATTLAGDVSIAHGQKLLVNEINPIDANGNKDNAGTITLGGSIAVNGTTKLAGNAVINGATSIDSNVAVGGTLTVAQAATHAGSVSIANGQKLLVNEISPIDASGNQNTTGTMQLGGAIKIQSGRILGQTDVITFEDNTSTPIIKIYFTNASNQPKTPAISTGAFVHLHFFGTAAGNKNTTFFDVFNELEAFVGPGTFNNTTLAASNARTGNDSSAFGTVSIAPIYTAGTDSNGSYVQVELVVDGLANNAKEQYDHCAGTIYYEIISNNVDHIECPAGA